MSQKQSAAQLRRREEVSDQLEAIREAWPTVKASLDKITEEVGIKGIDAARVFFVLATQSNELDNPAEALGRWANHRLTQIEALEALSSDQKEALGLDKDKLAEASES